MSAAPKTHTPPMHAAQTAPPTGSARHAAVQVPAIKYATVPLTPNNAAIQPTLSYQLLLYCSAPISFNPRIPSLICPLLM